MVSGAKVCLDTKNRETLRIIEKKNKKAEKIIQNEQKVFTRISIDNKLLIYHQNKYLNVINILICL